MRIDVISVFPEYLAPLRLSLIGRAAEDGPLEVRVHDLRAWAHDRHRTVDDTPYGGGAGMVMRPDVWGEAIDDVAGLGRTASDDGETGPDAGPAAAEGGPAAAGDGPESPHRAVPGQEPSGPVDLILPTPSGTVFTQSIAGQLARSRALVFACGRYEGIDARVAEHYASRPPGQVRVHELSIGDYVLAGGEAAALVMIEAIARLVPGVLGNPDSLLEESHGPDGLLEYPIYTKPPAWRGLAVPPILLSGDHGRIAAWRREQAIGRTRQRRQDLLAGDLSEPDATDGPA